MSLVVPNTGMFFDNLGLAQSRKLISGVVTIILFLQVEELIARLNRGTMEEIHNLKARLKSIESRQKEAPKRSSEPDFEDDLNAEFISIDNRYDHFLMHFWKPEKL